MNILCSDIKYKFEKLEYLREIQRLKSAITCYQESENFAGKDVSLYDVSLNVRIETVKVEMAE